MAAPSDNYDIRLLDHTGYDLLEGLGANRDTIAPEQVNIIYASTSVNPCVDETDTLTLVIDNQFTASAQVEVTLYYALR